MEKISYRLNLFEGPLDLLLHLIKKNKLNICDIQISELLDQYMEHIDLMKEQNMDIASEFLEMAARLVYIKTSTLLPKHESEAEMLKEELKGQLLEYEQCKKMAKILEEHMQLDFISRDTMKLDRDMTYSISHNINEIFKAYVTSMGKNKKNLPPIRESFNEIVAKKIISVFSKGIYILKSLKRRGNINFLSLFRENKSKSEAVATFLALLELVKSKRVFIEKEGNNLEVKLSKEK